MVVLAIHNSVQLGVTLTASSLQRDQFTIISTRPNHHPAMHGAQNFWQIGEILYNPLLFQIFLPVMSGGLKSDMRDQCVMELQLH
ncbi:hypothetical protein ACFO1V_00560 [Daeguia caeni]|uniref:Uncharacterized protein n=1 Tax=Daeguia caeni TaxID=439612 RepID=A0ABV9H433_9HYPH